MLQFVFFLIYFRLPLEGISSKQLQGIATCCFSHFLLAHKKVTEINLETATVLRNLTVF